MLFLNTKPKKRNYDGKKIPAKKYVPRATREVTYPYPRWLRSYTPIYYTLYARYPWWDSSLPF